MAKPKLTAKELRILELACDVCQKLVGTNTDYLGEHAMNAKEALEEIRETYGSRQKGNDR